MTSFGDGHEAQCGSRSRRGSLAAGDLGSGGAGGVETAGRVDKLLTNC